MSEAQSDTIIAARWQHPVGQRIQCDLCPHNCLLSEGQISHCHTRQNRGGELMTLSFGNPCSLGVDPIEKKPLFHFYPGEKVFSLATGGCNFHCLNCQNAAVSQHSPIELQRSVLSPVEVVTLCLDYNCKLLAFTYTEPTVFYEYMLEIAQLARKKDIATVMISNGYINPEPLAELLPWIDAANIDVKVMDEKIYHKLTGGRLMPVLDTVLTLKEKGIWLEITNLLIPGMTDDRRLIQKLCDWMVDHGMQDVPLHFSRFHPDYRLLNVSPTPESTLLMAREMALESGLHYVYMGNLHSSEGEDTSCPRCHITLISRSGFQVLNSRLIDGKCPKCGHPIAGRW